MAILLTPGQTVAGPDWEALFAQHGGSQSNQIRPPTKSEQDAADNAGDDLEQNPIYRYYAADGSYVEARKAQNGDYQIVDYKPSQKFQENQRKDPDSPASRNAKRDEDEEAWNADPANRAQGGSGRRETHRARDERLAKEKEAAETKAKAEAASAETRAARPGTKIGSKTDVRGGKKVTIETWRLPDGTTEERISEEPAETPKSDQVTVGGVIYERGPDGNYAPAAGLPGSGTPLPGGAGPAMPTIVLGQSQAALRAYRDQLQQEVASGRKTQVWADGRWKEALELANVAVAEATTQQRQQESSLNARVNLATTKLTNQMTGMQQALSFAQDLNGKLPPGSSLGGEAFAAMLGLQMIMAQRSGIYDITPSSADMRSTQAQQIDAVTSAAVDTTRQQVARLTNPASPDAVAAERAAVQAQLEAATGTAPATPAMPTAPAQPAPIIPTTGAPTPAAAARPAPAIPVQAAAPTLPEATPGGGNPPPPPVPPATVSQPTFTAPFQDEQQQVPAPFNADPAQEPVGMAPQPYQQFAALTALQPPPAAPVSVPATPESAPFTAALTAEADATPPWRLSPQRIEEMIAAGVPEDRIWAVPGAAA